MEQFEGDKFEVYEIERDEFDGGKKFDTDEIIEARFMDIPGI